MKVREKRKKKKKKKKKEKKEKKRREERKKKDEEKRRERIAHLLVILFEAAADKILDLKRVLGPRQHWWRLLGDRVEDAHRVQLRVRREPGGHLNYCDPQRPDVRSHVVARVGDDLRRHPRWSADECVLPRHAIRQLASHSKVAQLDTTVLGQQDVGGWWWKRRNVSLENK